MVNLIDSDLGRSIMDITTNIQHLDLTNNIKSVLKTSQPLEKEVTLSDGRYYSLRISPYMRRDKSVDGAVVNFIDVTEARQLTSILESVLNSSISGVVAKRAIYDAQQNIVDFEYISVNLASEKVMGMSSEKILGKRMGDVLPELERKYFPLYKEVVMTGQPRHFDYFDQGTGSMVQRN